MQQKNRIMRFFCLHPQGRSGIVAQDQLEEAMISTQQMSWLIQQERHDKNFRPTVVALVHQKRRGRREVLLVYGDWKYWHFPQGGVESSQKCQLEDVQSFLALGRELNEELRARQGDFDWGAGRIIDFRHIKYAEDRGPRDGFSKGNLYILCALPYTGRSSRRVHRRAFVPQPPLVRCRWVPVDCASEYLPSLRPEKRELCLRGLRMLDLIS